MPRDHNNLDKFALVVTDINWHSTEHLFENIQEDVIGAFLARCDDYGNAWRRGVRPWQSRWWSDTIGLGAAGQGNGTVTRRELVLPPGWMKRFPRWGMSPIANAIRRWRRDHARGRPWVLVVTYPHYWYLAQQLRPDFLVYLNLDDYRLYWPNKADEVRMLEHRLVAEADLTCCVARLRAWELVRAVPKALSRIIHLPHGAPESMITPGLLSDGLSAIPADLASLPRPWLGYVGGLEDRIDWALLERVAKNFPRASLILIGTLPPDARFPANLSDADGKSSDSWLYARARTLQLPNVHALGWRAQDRISEYNSAFDVALIPYQVRHAFNQACCPTKIFDIMGTGRPMVSTDLPECRLYRRVMAVATDHEDFLRATERMLSPHADGLHEERRLLAIRQSCTRQWHTLRDQILIRAQSKFTRCGP